MLSKTILTKRKKSPERKQRRFLGFFITPLMAILLLTIFMSQCKKDDFTGEIVGVCPLVISTDPIDEAINVALNKVITATFNENMDPATINSTSFILMQGTNPISGTVAPLGVKASTGTSTINSKSQLKQGSNPVSEMTTQTATYAFTPKEPLAPSTLYTATIKKGVRDPMKNALQEDKVWSFTTGIQQQYTIALSSNPTLGGTTTGAGSYDSGTSVTVKAVPATGYNFINWTEGTDIASTDVEYIFTITKNRTLVANFTTIGLTLNVAAANGIVVKVPDQQTYTLGDIVVLTATANTGYEFTSWSGDATGTDNPLTVLMDGNKNITANFTAIPPIGPPPIDLDCAAPFAIIAGSGISSTGLSIINGDVALFPGSALVGFPPGVINGDQEITTPIAEAAKICLTAAYIDGQGRTENAISLPGQLGGLTYAPGLYSNSSTSGISGTGPNGILTLDAQGNADAVWIFQIGSTLTTDSGSH